MCGSICQFNMEICLTTIPFFTAVYVLLTRQSFRYIITDSTVNYLYQFNPLIILVLLCSLWVLLNILNSSSKLICAKLKSSFLSRNRQWVLLMLSFPFEYTIIIYNWIITQVRYWFNTFVTKRIWTEKRVSTNKMIQI